MGDRACRRVGPLSLAVTAGVSVVFGLRSSPVIFSVIEPAYSRVLSWHRPVQPLSARPAPFFGKVQLGASITRRTSSREGVHTLTEARTRGRDVRAPSGIRAGCCWASVSSAWRGHLARPSDAAHAAAQDWSPFVLVTGLLLIGVVANDDGAFAAAGRWFDAVLHAPGHAVPRGHDRRRRGHGHPQSRHRGCIPHARARLLGPVSGCGVRLPALWVCAPGQCGLPLPPRLQLDQPARARRPSHDRRCLRFDDVGAGTGGGRRHGFGRRRLRTAIPLRCRRPPPLQPGRPGERRVRALGPLAAAARRGRHPRAP